MFQLATNIVNAPQQEKDDFSRAFAHQTTLNDKKIAETFDNNSAPFNIALVTYIRIALCHLNDNTLDIHKFIYSQFNAQMTHTTNNISSSLQNSLSPSPPSPDITNLAQQQTNLDIPVRTNLDNSQPMHQTPTPPASPNRTNNQIGRA